MREFERSVPSSDGESQYAVRFIFDGVAATVTCECSAATNVMFCRHREQFFVTRTISTFDPPQDGDEADLMYHIANSGIPAAYRQYRLDLDGLDQRKKDLATEATQIKKAFARRLAEGL